MLLPVRSTTAVRTWSSSRPCSAAISISRLRSICTWSSARPFGCAWLWPDLPLVWTGTRCGWAEPFAG